MGTRARCQEDARRHHEGISQNHPGPHRRRIHCGRDTRFVRACAVTRQRPPERQGSRRTRAAGGGRGRQGSDERTNGNPVRQDRQEGRVSHQRPRQRRVEGRAHEAGPRDRSRDGRGQSGFGTGVERHAQEGSAECRSDGGNQCGIEARRRDRESGKIPEARKIYEDLLVKYPSVYQIQGFIARTYAAETRPTSRKRSSTSSSTWRKSPRTSS